MDLNMVLCAGNGTRMGQLEGGKGLFLILGDSDTVCEYVAKRTLRLLDDPEAILVCNSEENNVTQAKELWSEVHVLPQEGRTGYGVVDTIEKLLSSYICVEGFRVNIFLGDVVWSKKALVEFLHCQDDMVFYSQTDDLYGEIFAFSFNQNGLRALRHALKSDFILSYRGTNGYFKNGAHGHSLAKCVAALGDLYYEMHYTNNVQKLKCTQPADDIDYWPEYYDVLKKYLNEYYD